MPLTDPRFIVQTTHDKVRNRVLMLIAMWTEDFESDPTLGIMEECYESLKAKSRSVLFLALLCAHLAFDRL